MENKADQAVFLGRRVSFSSSYSLQESSELKQINLFPKGRNGFSFLFVDFKFSRELMNTLYLFARLFISNGAHDCFTVGLAQKR